MTGQLPSADIADALAHRRSDDDHVSPWQALPRVRGEHGRGPSRVVGDPEGARRSGRTPLGNIACDVVLVGRDDRLGSRPGAVSCGDRGGDAEDRRRKPPHGRRRSGIPPRRSSSSWRNNADGTAAGRHRAARCGKLHRRTGASGPVRSSVLSRVMPSSVPRGGSDRTVAAGVEPSERDRDRGGCRRGRTLRRRLHR